MRRQPIYCRGLHFHLVSQGIAFQFKGARGGDHARVIHKYLARETNSGQAAVHFDDADQNLAATAALDVDQFQLAVFKDADESVLPMGDEILGLPIETLLGALFVCQRIFIAAGECQPFAIVERINGGILPAPLACPCAFEEGEEVRGGCGIVVHGSIVTTIRFNR
jgi:hypothetical protein